MSKPLPAPTKAELAILQVLWDHGPLSVRQVHDALKDARGTGYSTTLKLMQVMTDKGLLSRDDSVRPQIYAASRRREKTQLQLVEDLIQSAFAGSASSLILRAIAARPVDPKELAEIRKIIDQAKGDSK